MSGGHYDYVFSKLNAAAAQVLRDLNERERPAKEKSLRRAMAKKMQQMADALYELEWCDSGDTSWEQAEPLLRAIVKPADELQATLEAAKEVQSELTGLIALLSSKG